MAQRRMFSLQVVGSDQFLDMPLSTQALYLHLGMYADDDGFVTPQKILRMIGGTADDLKLLIAKQFIIPFESGVIVIRHWKENNYIQADRYKPTSYTFEKQRLACIQNVYELDTQDRLGKDRLGKSKVINTVAAPIRKHPKTAEHLKALFLAHPQFSALRAKYPDRDYEHQLDLMADWWITNRGKLPVSISALANWLRNTKPDPEIEGERKRREAREDTHRRLQEMSVIPVADQSKIDQLKARMAGIGRSI